jgi:MFS family permease
MELWIKFKQLIQSNRLFGSSSDETEGQESQTRDHVKYKHISDDDEATELKSGLFKYRSIDDILDDIGLRLLHLRAFLLLGVLNMTHSLEVSMLSIILPSLKAEWNLSSLLAGVLTLSLSIGIIVGCWFWGWVSDKYGRKRGFISSASSIFVFAFSSALSPNYYWLCCTLFLVGFGIATIFETYVMTMELFPPKYRSTFSILNAAFWTLGFLLSAITSIELSVIGYRWALAIVCFPSAIFLIGFVFLPDTPHYHLAAGDEPKALKILQDFAPEMDLSGTRLERQPESERADITQLFRSGHWKITICACIATFTIMMAYYMLIFTASDVAFHYSENTSAINSSSDVNGAKDALYSTMAWMNLPELVMIITVALGCYIFAVERAVLALLLFAIILQTVASFVLKNKAVLLVLTMLSRSLVVSAVNVFYVYISLLYPTETRSIGVGVSFSTGHIGMIIGPFIFETIFDKDYYGGILSNIGVLVIGLISTALLPSHRSDTLD